MILLLKYLLFKIVILFYFLISSLFSFKSVCDFPLLDDRQGCQRGQENLENKNKEQIFNWFCDPESIISMSEVTALGETINKLTTINSDNCVCENNKKNLSSLNNNYCWYYFGFGFLRKLNLENEIIISSSNQCKIKLNKTTNIKKSLNLENNITNYGNNFVNILRERWKIGNCGEDIIILFIQIPPMIFVSFGYLMKQQLEINKINKLINQTNLQLFKNTKPQFRILSNFIENILILLNNNLNIKKQKKQFTIKRNDEQIIITTRNHIPLWAWAIFGLCGIAFLLMALSLFAIRSKTRRGLQGNKLKYQRNNNNNKAIIARRYWKEREEQLQQTPQTYVNLVQMLMPHPKYSPTNLQQQF